MKNCVYKFINKNNEVIYIGKAKNLESRMNNHNHLNPNCYKELDCITYAIFNSEDEMDFAERYYIQKMNPKYNTFLSGKTISFTCDELDNKKFEIFQGKSFDNKIAGTIYVEEFVWKYIEEYRLNHNIKNRDTAIECILSEYKELTGR